MTFGKYRIFCEYLINIRCAHLSVNMSHPNIRSWANIYNFSISSKNQTFVFITMVLATMWTFKFNFPQIMKIGHIWFVVLHSYIHKWYSHILLVLQQYSYVRITLLTVTWVPQQTTRHSGNIHYAVSSACVTLALCRPSLIRNLSIVAFCT